jgi:hypothetical protein
MHPTMSGFFGCFWHHLCGPGKAMSFCVLNALAHLGHPASDPVHRALSTAMDKGTRLLKSKWAHLQTKPWAHLTSSQCKCRALLPEACGHFTRLLLSVLICLNAFCQLAWGCKAVAHPKPLGGCCRGVLGFYPYIGTLPMLRTANCTEQ